MAILPRVVRVTLSSSEDMAVRGGWRSGWMEVFFDGMGRGD